MSRFIQTQYSNKQPPDFHGYMNYSLLRLERALSPVLHVVNQLDHDIKFAESYCHFPSRYNLTRDESAALYLYTREWGTQHLHHVLNQALMSGEYSLIRPWFGFLKLLNTALGKLPSVKGIIWRAVHIDIVQYFQQNEKITWWNVSSCSSSLVTIRRLLDSHSILCSIEALNGKSVRDFTMDSTEDEVLLLPGTRLRVKDKKKDHSTGRYILFLEEISNEDYKTPISTEKPISSTNKSPKVDSRSNNSTTSDVSTADVIVNNRPPDKDELKNNAVFSTTTFSNGDTYEVAYKNGKKQADSVYFCGNTKIYQYHLADSKATGKGLRTFTNGDRYEGTFGHGRMNGYGTYFRADGFLYIGNWVADEPFGTGKSIWPNGNYCEGFHENGKIQGRGKCFSANGDKYEGDLVDGKSHGWGKRLWKDGDRYEGSFKDDKKHGYGTYEYGSGGRYTGNWANDEISGHGSLEYRSGTRYKGEFKNGKRHGLGKLTFSNGQAKDGLWENDKFIG